jgi:isopenicillin N synthase-like dioxygenase
MLEIVDWINFTSRLSDKDNASTLLDSQNNGVNLQQIHASLKNQGFLVVKNAQLLPQEMVEKAFRFSKNFFNDVNRSKITLTRETNNIGYQPIHSEHLDPSKAFDVKEGLNLGKFAANSFQDCIAKGFIPSNSEHFPGLPKSIADEYDFLQEFSRRCHELCLQILEVLAVILKMPDEDGLPGQGYFVRRHRYNQPSGDILRFLKYPPTHSSNVQAGAHSDYGSLTLLFQKDIGGLQILSPTEEFTMSGYPTMEAILARKQQGEWKDVPVFPPGHIIVNTGDMMESWTSGLWKSSIHRVLANSSGRDRYSIPYFCHPEDNVPLFIDSKEISNAKTAREWLNEKLKATMA